eukprot:5656879-Alexandrium_andersonii.AAC.1
MKRPHRLAPSSSLKRWARTTAWAKATKSQSPGSTGWAPAAGRTGAGWAAMAGAAGCGTSRS